MAVPERLLPFLYGPLQVTLRLMYRLLEGDSHMATPRTRILKLYLSSGITTEAKANLEILDSLGAVYYTDSSQSVVIRSKESLTFRPRDPSVGGSGVGGSITFGDPNQRASNFTVYADNTLFVKPIKLQSTTTSSTLELKTDVASNSSLNFSLSGDRTITLDGNLSISADLSFIGTGVYTLPGTGTVVTTTTSQTLTNKTIDAANNTLIGITSSNISNAAAIPYSKLVLSGSIVDGDVSASAGIEYSKLSLVGKIRGSDVDPANPIPYSKLSLANSISNADISASAGIPYSKLNLLDQLSDADINDAAEISLSKLETLPPDRLLISDALGKLTPVVTLPTVLGGTGVSGTATYPTSGTILTNANNVLVSGKSISGATNNFSNIPYSALSLVGSVTNTDISATASIDYSKLNLTGNISNTDISNDANIAGTKVLTSFGNQWLSTQQGLEMIEGGLYTRVRAAIDGQSSSLEFALPPNYGSNGQVLATNGSGEMAWVSVLTDNLANQYVDIGDTEANRTATDTGVLGDILASTLTGLTIKASVVTDSKISPTAAIALTKLAASTPSVVPQFDTSGFLVPSSTTSTELSYLSGVTSSIQDQLDSKQASGDYISSLTGEVTATGPGAASATVSNSAIIGKVLTGFAGGVNSPIVATDSILQAFNKTQGQLDGKQTSGDYITSLTGDVVASGPGVASSSIASTVVTGKLLTGYTVGSNATIASTDTILQAFGKTQGQINRLEEVIEDTQEPMGFVDKAEVILSYDPTTRTVSVAPVASTFSVWVQGIKYAFSSVQSVAHADVTGAHYIVFNSSGTLVSSTASFDWETEAFVAYVSYDTAQTPKGFAVDELHMAVMDWATHRELHERIGTYVVSGGLLDSASYLLAPGTPTNAGNRPAITSALVADEDNRTSLPALADNGPYTTMYKSGAAGAFLWQVSNANPYLYNVGTNAAQYNQFTGGAWQLTDVASGDFVNYYLFLIPSVQSGVSAQFRYVWIPGQASYSSLANARTESVLALNLTGLPASEIVPRYKVTLRRSNTYTTQGRVRIEEVTLISGSAATLVSTTNIGASDHRALSFRDAADQHPTSAISFPAQSPATPLAFDQIMDRVWSSGSLYDITITKNGDGTVNVGATDFVLRTSNSNTAPLKIYNIPGVNNLALTDEASNYIYANYNGGSPQWAVTTDITTIPCTDKCIAAIASRVGNTVYTTTLPFIQTDFMAKTERRLFNVNGMQRANGADLTTTNRTVAVTAGQFYFVNNLISSPAFDTAVASTFTYVYKNGSGGWTRTATQTLLTNSKYDDGSGTLATAATGTYVISWVYLVLDEPTVLYVVYGNQAYASIDVARNAQPPEGTDLPPELRRFSTAAFIGRCIIEQGTDNCEDASPFLTPLISVEQLAATGKYFEEFDTVDWAGPSGGFYSYTVLASTHGKGKNLIAQVFQLDSGEYELVLAHSLRINSVGDVTIRVPEVPDSRFQGKIVIS